MRGSRNFCQFYLVLNSIFSLHRGSNGLLLRKLYFYFTKDPKGDHYFPGEGVSNFFQRGGGVQMLISIEKTYTYLFSKGVSGPPIPLWIRTWAMSSEGDNIYHSPASNPNCQALICQI